MIFNTTSFLASLPLIATFFGVDSDEEKLPLFDVESAESSFPTAFPTASPSFSSFSPTGTCHLECKTDYDCPSVCQRADPYDPFGTCVGPSSPSPSAKWTDKPTMCECTDPSNIPDWCEVDVLIDIMETHVLVAHELLPQWTRAAFHDAGTFDKSANAGGANGCLLNYFPMRLEPENAFLHLPLNTLMDVKNEWEQHPSTCIRVSSADILQFAAFFATIRQSQRPESMISGTDTAAEKRNRLKKFVWGRPDEINCDTMWVDNLPSNPSTRGGGIAGRCTAAGREIKTKMIDKNGFTAAEATVLIGAHTIGMIRNTFGPGLAGPWVDNGRDNATPLGPIFDNAYHDFLINTVVENDANTFAVNVAPFDNPQGIFPSWFRDFSADIDHLDTDLALAFPPLNPSHPDFSAFTASFASDNSLFLDKFFAALEKMSRLGVRAKLFPATECKDRCGEPSQTGGGLDAADILRIVTQLGNSTAFADDAISGVQANRMVEIFKLTTPDKQTKSPTSKPSPRPTFNLRPTMKASNKPVIMTARPTPRLTLKPVDKPFDFNQTKTLVPTRSLTMKPSDRQSNQTKTLLPTLSLTMKPSDRQSNQTKTLVPTPGLTMKPSDRQSNQTKTLVPTRSLTMKPADKPIDFNQTRTHMPTPSLTKPIDFNQTKTLVPMPSLTMRPSDKPTVKPESNQTE